MEGLGTEEQLEWEWERMSAVSWLDPLIAVFVVRCHHTYLELYMINSIRLASPYCVHN
jgi:hypothetical protein